MVLALTLQIIKTLLPIFLNPHLEDNSEHKFKLGFLEDKMSSSITEAFVKQFNANIMFLSQQKGSRLQGLVRKETQRGKSQFFDRLGPVTATKKTSRHSDTPQIDTPHSRRRVTMSDYEHADLIDDADKVRTLIDPASEYAMTFVWAFGRAKDDEIIAAADGNAFGGEEGSTVIALPNSQKLACVSGGAGSNMNVECLRRTKEKFDANDVDESIRRYIAQQSSQLTALLGETEVTSADFNTVKALVQGDLDTFLGFTFVRLERLLLQSGTLAFDVTTGAVGSGGGDADGYRRVLSWAEDGLILTTGEDIKTRIDERADKSYSTQVFTAMTIGSTRLEEVKVVQILANEA